MTKKIDKTKAFIIGMGALVFVLAMGDLYSEANGGHSHGGGAAGFSENDGHSHE